VQRISAVFALTDHPTEGVPEVAVDVSAELADRLIQGTLSEQTPACSTRFWRISGLRTTNCRVLHSFWSATPSVFRFLRAVDDAGPPSGGDGIERGWHGRQPPGSCASSIARSLEMRNPPAPDDVVEANRPAEAL